MTRSAVESCTVMNTNRSHAHFMHKKQSPSGCWGFNSLTCWRRGGESNPRVKVLQTSALPLGYRAGVSPYYLNSVDQTTSTLPLTTAEQNLAPLRIL